MMTSMGPSFAGHPAGMHQHPGVPGHPMAQGMPHNPSQQGAHAGGMPQQVHMAVSGPGGQVNPAALMGGMPPGAGGPNAHALQHLNPAQNPMFQQSQFAANFGNSPAAMAQLQQQRFIQQQNAQRQQQQHMFAQHAYQANMQGVGVNGMPMGVPMNQAQLQAMRQARMQHPHSQNQALLAQQIALQQQQQVAQQQNQQMQQGNQPGHPVQMNAQHLQQLQQAQLAASMQAQQQSQQGPGQPQQAQPQGQQGGPQQQQTPQQQQSQPGNPQSAGHPTPSQTPGPQPNQQPQPPMPPNQPQGPQQAMQHPQQQGAQPQQQQQQQQQQLAQQQAAQTAFANNMLAQQAAAQQRREGMKGHCLLKLMQFSEHLSGFPGPRGKDDLSYWNHFVQQFFSLKGVFRHSVRGTDEEQPDKQYEITYPALARYFHTHFDSGIRNMQLIMERGTTDRPLPGEGHWIENTKSSLVYWFESGSHVIANGTVRAHFDHEQKIELFEFITTGHEEYISRKAAIEAAKPAHNWIKEWRNINSQDSKGSPEMSKKGKPRPMKSPQNAPPDALVDLPESTINTRMGLTEPVFQFLEIAEVLGQMNPLFGFYHSHPGSGPYAALEQYVSQINSQPQNPNGPFVQPGQRTPAFSNFPVPVPHMGASPAQPHMQLPGSPHVMGSPAQGHVQAPGMQMQASQQGTSSSGPSANTSPASNKRRRPSAVKAEEDGSGAPTPVSGGPQVNGNKTKPPTPRMPKRVKGNPPPS